MSANFVRSAAFILFIVLILFVSGCAGGQKGKYNEFAQCLTEKGTVMYGTFWCPHCQKTKDKFGDSFQFINYVECDPRGDNAQPDRCIEEKIEGYDTWIFADGSRLIGEPKFEDMSEKTGCPLPPEPTE